MAIYLTNATYIDWETLDFRQCNIWVEQGPGKSLIFDDKQGTKPISDHLELDCTNKLVTRSFGVGHHHAYSALARGMPAPRSNPGNFNEILKFIWWNLDKALDKEMIEASALATAMACAKAGSTFVIDHHASPNFINNSLHTIAGAFEKVGIAHLLCYEISDRDGEEKSLLGLQESERYLQSHQALVGLHASFTLSDNTLRKAAELAYRFNTGVHVHVAEDLCDQKHCIEKYGKRVVNRLNEFGLLQTPKTILVHCLHLDQAERELISSSPVWVAQNTESNLNNNVGTFSGSGLNPGRIMLGTDGMHSDMLQSAKAAFFNKPNQYEVDFHGIYHRFRNIHRYMQSNQMAGDGANNLVVLDYDSPTPLGQDNFLGHFVFGIRSNHVQHVISNGKLIVRDKKLTTVDECDALKFTREQAIRLWAKL